MVLISGPVSMYYLKKKDKRVYLFGDEHYTTNGVCTSASIDIIGFFDKIFNSTIYKDKIDFYVESHYSDIEVYTKRKNRSLFEELKYKIFGDQSHSFLLKIINYYQRKGCFMKSDKECKTNYPNVDFHPADFRRSVKCKYTKAMDDFTNDLFILSVLVNYGYNIKKYVKKINPFSTYEKVKKYILSALKCSPVKIEMKHCDRHFNSLIKKYIKETFKKFDKNYKHYYNETTKAIIKGFDNRKKMYSISEMSFAVRSLLSMVIDMNSIAMDIYLLSKMFKEQRKLVFVYAGNAHIQNYVYFLEKYMKFKLVSGGIAHKKRCIEAKKLY